MSIEQIDEQDDDLGLSIITVCLNASSSIGQNINSIKLFCEEYPNSEHIIIDGNSSDDTLDTVKLLQHERLHWQSENDKGTYDAMNKGLNIATKKYVLFINADDFLCDTRKLNETLKLFTENSAIEIIFGDIDIVNSQGQIVRIYHTSKWFKHWMFLVGIAPPHPGTIYKRNSIGRMNGFDPDYKITGDFDLALRMSSFKNYIMSGNVFTKMQVGGLSSRGLQSYTTSTIEIARSLKNNNSHSWILSPLRLLIKYYYGKK
mgnify:CR=1 FL=1